MTSHFDRTTATGRPAVQLAELSTSYSEHPPLHRARPMPDGELGGLPSILRLRALLLGDDRTVAPLPHLADLTSAVITLARGLRRKVLLPLGESSVELALVRHEASVLVSHYTTDSAPEVLGLNRPVELEALLQAAAVASLDALELTEADAAAEMRADITRRLAERARQTTPVDTDTVAPPGVAVRRGGGHESADEGAPLAFEFEARIPRGPAAPSSRSSRADIHAMLFPGTLWAHVHGNRVPLAQGPILLAVHRMVVAVRALVDAFDAGRAMHVRLRAGGFQVGARMTKQRRVTLTFGGEQTERATVRDLDLVDAALPILRLASELTRALVGVDRSQTRNLRVRAVRDEVRTLRRAVRTREKTPGFVNLDPDRLRASAPPAELDAPKADVAPVRTLRFGERWRIAIDGLDAMSTFLCGDRIVLATPSHCVALGREQGEVLWVRSGAGTSSFMAGRALVRMTPEGVVEFCDVEDGEPYATTFIEPAQIRDTPGRALVVGGGAIPQMAVFVEGKQDLVALDLATGQARWRFSPRAGGRLKLTRAGRLLLVAESDGALHALDVATGEEVWCFRERERFDTAPLVSRDRVLLAGGALGSQRGSLHALDLFSGERLWARALPGGPLAAPIIAGDRALCVSEYDDGLMRAFELTRGDETWATPDPGLASGASCLAVDGVLISNSPAGSVSALDAESGDIRWSASLADPVADDVPRRLEPILRGGAMFVPAATVHVLRPHDGSSVGSAIPCELVPDWLRVDERGWVYIAEESGHVAAYAPVPHLALVR